MSLTSLISKKIKFLRKSNRYSQEKFGSLFGYSQKTVSFWELGEIQPDYKTLQAIGEQFNKPIEWFFKEDDALSNDKKAGVKRYPEIVHTDNSNAGTIDDNMASAIEGRILELKDTDNLILEALNRIADSLENVRGELSDVKKICTKQQNTSKDLHRSRKREKLLQEKTQNCSKTLLILRQAERLLGKPETV